MVGAFPIEPNGGYEILPDFEVINCKGQRQYIAFRRDGKKKILFLVTLDQAGEINIMDDEPYEESDTV